MAKEEVLSTKTEVPVPLMLWDGDCGFCRAWVEYWKHLTGDHIEYEPYQSGSERFPEIPREKFTKAVALALPNGEVRRAAHAVFTSLARVPGKRWLLWSYDHLPGFAAVTETAYGTIARHRSAAYRVTKFLWGIPIHAAEKKLVSEAFLRALALIYIIAFASFGVQALGLIGSNGIVPIQETLGAIRHYYPGQGFRLLPTVFWISASNKFIVAICVAGVVLGLLLFLGIAKRISCVALYVLYLSLVSAGQVFMGFQWDALLLESGFLAIFLGWSPLVPWLYRWLAFRLMFMSGMVKLLSGDPNWRNLTALEYHYMTQPLPDPLSWFMYHLPAWFQQMSTGAVLVLEVGIPFLIFFPRRVRYFGFWCLIALQLLIFLTGNYTFFNLLAMALFLFLLDDDRLARWAPKSWAEKIRSRVRATGSVRKAIASAACLVLLVLSGLVMAARIGNYRPELGGRLMVAAAPFEIANSYGLFAVMTTERPEIILEGSNDGITWKAYEFKYKPGDLYRMPRWVQPHQPRLDWQMWFAALGSYRENLWVLNLIYRLLDGSPDVLRLMDNNPFPAKPPQYIRAMVYDYRFTTWREWRTTGAWWQRELRGPWLPPVSLQDYVKNNP